MRRLVHLFSGIAACAALAGFGGLGACGGSNSGPDASTPDASAADSGNSGNCTGTAGSSQICTVSSMNTLPAPWTSANAADFAVDNSGAASAYLNSVVEFTGMSMTAGGAVGSGCPPAFVYETYCDGFYANVAGGLADGGTASIYVGDFSYLSSSTACASQFSGASLSTIRGVWYDYYNSTLTPTDYYVIALTSCCDVGVTTGGCYAGMGTPPAMAPAGSQSVHALLTGSAGDKTTQTVSGVVVAAYGPSSKGSFGFSLEDPAGGPQSALSVTRSSSSSSTAAAPNIGDYITITGTFEKSYAGFKL
jgi:hypothetical protein